MKFDRTLALVAAAFLAGCSTGGPGVLTGTPPPARTAATPMPQQPRLEPRDPLSEFYAEIENGLTTTGKMRRDTAPADIPYSADDLVRNFERIALHDEYVEVQGRFLARETPALLRRWDRPVRVGVVTGPSMPEAEAARDRGHVGDFTRRLAGLTGLDMAVTEGEDANFLVMFLSSGEQEAFAEQAAARFSQFDPAVLEAVRATSVDTFCTAFAFADPEAPSVYAAVLVLIKAEHPELTRHSCVEEEMAQAMGLPNDSPDARPSLFNGGLEFAFLTEHDEILLRMLYDPRLKPGMAAAEARPILPEIAQDAMAAQNAELSRAF